MGAVALTLAGRRLDIQGLHRRCDVLVFQGTSPDLSGYPLVTEERYPMLTQTDPGQLHQHFRDGQHLRARGAIWAKMLDNIGSTPGPIF